MKLGVYLGAAEGVRMSNKLDRAFSNQVHVLEILLGLENDLVLLKALLLETRLQLRHVGVGVLLK